MSIIGIIFAILGLSFLIFIHELGHYFMAKKAGMKIEVFSIGMGKPIFSWKRNGVKWQVCFLIFGGYVRIAGMDAENGKEPYQIKNGFYSKKPIYRLLVAGAGPFVNIVFALLVFTVIYFWGGQKKPFSQYTKLIGRVDKTSQVYEEGIRAGDKIISINNKPYQGFRDILIQGMLKHQKNVNVMFDKQNNEFVETTLHPYSPQRDNLSGLFPKEWKSVGVLSPASYVVSQGFIEGKKQYSPLYQSTIKKGDRIVYADGEIIYSVSQLADIVNKDIVLLTIDRNGKKLHLQVPRVVLGDLKLSMEQRDEFVDYKREMNLEGALASTYFIPYLVSDGLYIKDQILLIEDENNIADNAILKKGDKILAVAGENVLSPEDFYKAVATRKCLIMVSNKKIDEMSWKDCDNLFLSGIDKNSIALMEENIGNNISKMVGSYRFLKPSEPISFKSYLQKANPNVLEKMKAGLDKDTFQKLVNKNTLFSGVNLQDQKVVYNPGPIVQAKDILNDIFFSLKGLFSGSISPKHMSGPVGMVKIVHDESKSSAITGLYWIGMISLNLGFFNLLPIPMMDGGHICFTMYEVITKKRIKAKTMQKLVFPFFVLIIAFFVYVTFHDLIKVFS